MPIFDLFAQADRSLDRSEGGLSPRFSLISSGCADCDVDRFRQLQSRAGTPGECAGDLHHEITVSVAGVGPSYTRSCGRDNGAGPWKEFTSKEGGFTVLMPGTPKEQTQKFATQVGDIEAKMFQLEAKPGQAYVMAYADYPEAVVKKSNPDKILDGARDGAAKKINGKVASEKKITLEKHPGREVEIEGPGNILIRVRVFLVKHACTK